LSFISSPLARDRPIPQSRDHDATIPEDRSGPAVLPLFCLAPHGVFRASQITLRAVSSYLAFSPLPALLSKNRRCLFCDTFRHRNFSIAAPAYFTRHAAVWCSDFPLANLAIHQRSSAIDGYFSIIWNPGNQESNLTSTSTESCGDVVARRQLRQLSASAFRTKCFGVRRCSAAFLCNVRRLAENA